jgi:hypothetical protein
MTKHAVHSMRRERNTLGTNVHILLQQTLHKPGNRRNKVAEGQQAHTTGRRLARKLEGVGLYT